MIDFLLYINLLIKSISHKTENYLSTCCPWSHGLRPKKRSVSVAVPPAPVRVPSQRSAANVKGDNEMILGAVRRSPGICSLHKAE